MSVCAISKLKKVGLALGAAPYGTFTANTAAFTRGLIVSSFECNPVQDVQPIEEVRGTLGISRVTKGIITYAPKLSFPLDAGDGYGAHVGDFLASVYGQDTGSVDGAFFKHKFTLKESCDVPWFNIVSDKDAVTKQVVGFVPGSVKFTIGAKETQIPVDVEGIAQKEMDGYGTTSLAYSDEPIMSGTMITELDFGGASATNIESIEVTVMREQEAMNFLTQSSRSIGSVVSGKSFSINFTANGLVFDDETERNKFINVTNTNLTMTLTDSIGNYVKFYFPQLNYQTFDGPSLTAGDLLRVAFTGLVTGTASAHYIEIRNKYGYNYGTGAAIV